MTNSLSSPLLQICSNKGICIPLLLHKVYIKHFLFFSVHETDGDILAKSSNSFSRAFSANFLTFTKLSLCEDSRGHCHNKLMANISLSPKPRLDVLGFSQVTRQIKILHRGYFSSIIHFSMQISSCSFCTRVCVCVCACAPVWSEVCARNSLLQTLG